MSAVLGDVGNAFDDGVAQRVTADLQHAARDEQEEQEDAAHDYHQVHPPALPERRRERQEECEEQAGKGKRNRWTRRIHRSLQLQTKPDIYISWK